MEVFFEAGVSVKLAGEAAARVLETVIAWGRHGEVFEYDYNAGTIHLPTGEDDAAAPDTGG